MKTMGYITKEEAEKLKENLRILENLAMEFGFLAHEKGWNIQKAQIEFDKLFRRKR